MSQSNDFMKPEIVVDVVTDQDLINTVFDISWYKIFPLFTLSRGARSYSSVYHVILSDGVSRKICQGNGYNILNYVYIIVLLDNDIYVGSAVCISRSRQHEKAKNITRVSHPLRFFAIRDIYKYPPALSLSRDQTTPIKTLLLAATICPSVLFFPLSFLSTSSFLPS